MIIKGSGKTPVGNKIAKGWKRDGNFRELSPAKENPQNPYNNPARANKTMKGTKAITGKLGS